LTQPGRPIGSWSIGAPTSEGTCQIAEALLDHVVLVVRKSELESRPTEEEASVVVYVRDRIKELNRLFVPPLMMEKLA
jgi:hypothetical protein